MENEDIFNIPTDEETLVIYAKRHFENCLDFSKNGVRCPELGCTDGPFSDSAFLFGHILLHKDLKFICGFCPQAFNTDRLLIVHFENDHSRTHEILNHLRFKIDTLDFMTQRTIDLQLQRNFVDYPIVSCYKENASLITVCQIPQSAKFIRSEDEVTQILEKCFVSQVFYKIVRCPLIISNIVCGHEFESCRDLVLHLTTHFGIRAICKYCPETFEVIDEAVDNHNEKMHHACITCDQQFEDLISVIAHKCEIELLLSPYKYAPPEIDLNCALYLPNLAFHHTNMEKIDYESACHQNHRCVFLPHHLTTSKEHVYYLYVKMCFDKEVINYSKLQECPHDFCEFEYKICRELLVHVLLKHSSNIKFSYFCKICIKHFEKNNSLQLHINREHPAPTCQTCLLSYDSKLNLSMHQYSTGHKTE